MYCKVCLKEIDEYEFCEACGDGGMCEDCAAECAEFDDEEAFD